MKTIFYNGDIVTMDDSLPSASAIMTEGGKILCVGSDSEVLLRKSGGTVCINLKKKTILPGFIDGHSHFASYATELMYVNLSPSPKGSCDTIEMLIEMGIREMSKKNYAADEWFIGAGFDNSVFPDCVMPTRNDLDRISTESPVMLIHFSCNLAVLNSRALFLLGIGRGYVPPKGGNIGLFPGGEPNGQLFGAAYRSAARRIKLIQPQKYLKAIKKASLLYAKRGITTVQDGNIERDCYPLLKAAKTLRLFSQDIVCYASADSGLEPNTDKSVPIIGLKLFLDGTPHFKTAWLTEPYLNPPQGSEEGYCSGRRVEDEELITTMEDCLCCSIQFNIHACGDAAIDQAIDCFAEAKRRRPDSGDIRPVLIHSQLLRADRLCEMQKLGMRASFLIDHLYYKGDNYITDIVGGGRAAGAFPLKSAVRAGVKFTLHQDTPALLPDMFLSIQTAVLRRTSEGRILGESEALTPREALRAVTLDAAEQIFAEERKGSLAPGKDADFIICDRNPLKAPPESISKIKVLTTIKGGHNITV